MIFNIYTYIYKNISKLITLEEVIEYVKNNYNDISKDYTQEEVKRASLDFLKNMEVTQ